MSEIRQPTQGPGYSLGALVSSFMPPGGATYYSFPGRLPNAQALPGHLSEDEARGATYRPRMHPNAQIGHLPEDKRQEPTEIRQPVQGSGYSLGALVSPFMPGGSQPAKDRYQLLKEDFREVQQELENYKLELRRTQGELRSAKHHISELQHERQRIIDHANGLQNELNNVHQQLEDAKTLSEVHRKEPQVFLTKADTLSISEVREKVTVLNEEIFQAAATFGEALIHKRPELPQAELDAAVAKCQGMVGSKITNFLISQSQKPEPGVNPLLAQVVLQLFIVNFCVSKIQSWYPSHPAIGSFLNAVYSEIRSTSKHFLSYRIF